jgi:hypothetical protein
VNGFHLSLNTCPLVDYASAVALEVRTVDGSEPVVRMNFKNGTENFKTYNMLGEQSDVSLLRLLDTLSVSAILHFMSSWLIGESSARRNQQHSPVVLDLLQPG